MSKPLVLATLAAASVLTFGCAATDYAPLSAPFNKTHGIIGCSTDDRFANSQQTLESWTRDLNSTVVGPGGLAVCPGGFNPAMSSATVGSQDARDWNRFHGTYTFFGEQQVFGTGINAGTWIMAGVKDLPDGARRLNTYYSPNTTVFSCVGSVVDGRYGGPEGLIAGDALENPGAAAARIPGLTVESVAIDSSATNSQEFCGNIMATTPARAAAGYSSLWGLARSGEGRVVFTPVTRREGGGLSSFLSGGSLTVNVGDVSFTGRGQLLEDGTVKVWLDALARGGVTYQAVEPVWFKVDPSNRFRTVETHPTDAELARLARFALDAELTDVPLELGQVVPELGITLPDARLVLVGDTLRRFIDEQPGG